MGLDREKAREVLLEYDAPFAPDDGPLLDRLAECVTPDINVPGLNGADLIYLSDVLRALGKWKQATGGA